MTLFPRREGAARAFVLTRTDPSLATAVGRALRGIRRHDIPQVNCSCCVPSWSVWPAGVPHHVTQRGNRREAIFFEDGDHEIYRDLLAEQARKARVEVRAYCLMPNHVHLIMTPRTADGSGRTVGEAHRRYTNVINARGAWAG
jgi:hypothetical protein